MAKGLFGRLQQELDAREHVVGLTMAEILQLPTTERELISWILRSGDVSRSAFVARLGQAETAQDTITDLIAKGFLREEEKNNELYYSVRLAPRRKRELPPNLWQALTDKLE
ncbi:MAG: hypothetical protein KF832_21610 [Caldilineaceae bacterium]|nr:hypothetical protein [Caldilineaceae bacterium]